MRTALQAEFVMAAVIGMGVAHFHEHVYARPARQPDDVRWHDSDQLLDLVDDAALERLSETLRVALEELNAK
jgi:hypothetical protein